jgi:DNA mismatch repair protein MutH
MITRVKAIENLNKFIGISLYEKALEFNITVFKDKKQNKGWKGQVLERLAGLQNNNSKAPNGLGFELKSVSFVEKNGKLTPKETMAITMINPSDLFKNSFYESHCWEKLKSLVFCAVLWTEHNQEDSKLLRVTSFDFLEDNQIIKEIEQDYEIIREKLIKTGFESLTGKDGKWIQARTKGSGHGSTSRAFYAKKNLVKFIFNI